MENSLIIVYGIIYCATNLINGKKYIGQTKHSLEKRKLGHEKANCHLTIFKKAIQKYGKENFKWEIIDSASTGFELDYKEKLYIKIYNTFCKNGYGYNIAEGGRGYSLRYANKEKIEFANFKRSNSQKETWKNKSIDEKNSIIENRRNGQLLMTEEKKKQRADKVTENYKYKNFFEKLEISQKISTSLRNRPEQDKLITYKKRSAQNKRENNPQAKQIQCITTGDIFNCVKDAVDFLNLKCYKPGFVYKSIQESARNHKESFGLLFSYTIDASIIVKDKNYIYRNIRLEYSYKRKSFAKKVLIIETNVIFDTLKSAFSFAVENGYFYDKYCFSNTLKNNNLKINSLTFSLIER